MGYQCDARELAVPEIATFITRRDPPPREASGMRMIIICGDPECGEEYPADTGDRTWECPHCGRVRDNQYYPFLTAKLMNARIHSDEADWKDQHDELLVTAQGKVADLRDRAHFLGKDLKRLRVQVPEDERDGMPEPVSLDDVPDFLGGWSPDAREDDGAAWRDLHDRLLEGAREEIIALEDAVRRMEGEIKEIKSKHSIA
jgi:hypothetical protein